MENMCVLIYSKVLPKLYDYVTCGHAAWLPDHKSLTRSQHNTTASGCFSDPQPLHQGGRCCLPSVVFLWGVIRIHKVAWLSAIVVWCGLGDQSWSSGVWRRCYRPSISPSSPSVSSRQSQTTFSRSTPAALELTVQLGFNLDFSVLGMLHLVWRHPDCVRNLSPYGCMMAVCWWQRKTLRERRIAREDGKRRGRVHAILSSGSFYQRRLIHLFSDQSPGNSQIGVIFHYF